MNFSVLRVSLKNWVGISVNLFVVLAELLLAARVFFKFFCTAAGGSFFDWLNSTTDTLLRPFRHIFDSGLAGQPPTHWYVDSVALFAMAAYPLVFYAAVSVAGWLSRRK